MPPRSQFQICPDTKNILFKQVEYFINIKLQVNSFFLFKSSCEITYIKTTFYNSRSIITQALGVCQWSTAQQSCIKQPTHVVGVGYRTYTQQPIGKSPNVRAFPMILKFFLWCNKTTLLVFYNTLVSFQVRAIEFSTWLHIGYGLQQYFCCCYTGLPSWEEGNGVRLANRAMEIQIRTIFAQ